MIRRMFDLRQIFHAMTVVLLFSLASCGSAPPRQPLALEKAKKADHEAHRALRDGDLIRARELFNQSMLYQMSLDNRTASATAAINLSSVSHKLGDDSAALGLLDGILADSTAQVPAELRAAAAFRKGIILADTGKIAEAESALQLANQECNKQCAYAPGMNNLRARLALDKGDFASALSAANMVISAGAEKEEVANAHRIAAASETSLGHHEIALAHYQAALGLDKDLALSPRIAEDLKGISSVLLKLGRNSEADIFAHRAEAVIAASRVLPGKAANKPIP